MCIVSSKYLTTETALIKYVLLSIVYLTSGLCQDEHRIIRVQRVRTSSWKLRFKNVIICYKICIMQALCLNCDIKFIILFKTYYKYKYTAPVQPIPVAARSKA
jgi:hypothetical protein